MSTVAIDAGAERYDRQELIPGWNQRRLAEATVVVAGVGALGNEVAKNLALAGVGRLILCDPDTVAVSNLSRTVLFRPGDVGRPKAAAAAAALTSLVPGVVAEWRAADLGSGVGLGEIHDAAVVLSCVDTIRARMRLLGRCVLAGTALVDGGTHLSGGEIRLRLSPDEPCYGCSLSAHERGLSDVPWSCFGISEEGPQPASIAVAALVGAWMSLAAQQLVLGTVPAYRMLAIDAAGGRTAPVTTERDPECPHHRPIDGVPRLITVTNAGTIGDLLATLDPGEEPLAWDEFSLGARCGGCGRPAAGSRPGPGTPASQGAGLCPDCGGVMRNRFTQRLRDGDPGLRLADLGVAPEEILPVLLSGGEYRWVRLSR